MSNRHSTIIRNKWDKGCEVCGVLVKETQGSTYLGEDGKWHTIHCNCYDEQFPYDTVADAPVDDDDDLPF